MKNRKTRILMGIMVGLVLFSSSVALLLYLREEKTQRQTQTQKTVEVYVAARDLKKGDLFDGKSIVKAKLPKSYINFTPLTDSEIINRYAKVAIYKGEPIRLEKISATKNFIKLPKPVQTVKKTQLKTVPQDVKQVTTDTLSVSLSVFKNKNTLLRQGDYVDIVSAIPAKATRNTGSFHTRYIALHVKIGNFVSNGRPVSTIITYSEKKQPLRADTVVLVMSPKAIKNFLAVYYKTQALNTNRVYNTNNYGGQLWMVKTPKDIDPKLETEKKRLMVDRKIKSKKYKKHYQQIEISYEK